MRKGAARIEFYAVKDDVERLFAAGYNIRLAYEELVAQKKITMSYAAFNGYVNKAKNKKPRQEDASAVVPDTTLAPATSPSKFVHAPLADPDKMY